MKTTDNYKKHKNNNPLQKFLLGNFYKSLIEMLKPFGFAQGEQVQHDGKEKRLLRRSFLAPRNDEGGSIKSILDAGCGEGFTLNRLYQEKIGKELEGIDGSEKAISIGKKIHPHISLKRASIYELPYKNNSFDLVLSTEVLEHLETPGKALKEIIRVSKKYILLSVPNEPWFRISNFLRGKNIKRWGNDIEHINHWSSKSFQEFVNKEKIRILKKKTPFPWIIILIEKI